jgi:hypothetical protein
MSLYRKQQEADLELAKLINSIPEEYQLLFDRTFERLYDCDCFDTPLSYYILELVFAETHPGQFGEPPPAKKAAPKKKVAKKRATKKRATKKRVVKKQ